MQIDPGTVLVDVVSGARYTVIDGSRLNKVRVREVITNEEYVVDLMNKIVQENFIRLSESPSGNPDSAVHVMSEKEFERARRIYHLIFPLLQMDSPTKEQVAQVADQFDPQVHVSTVYRHLERCRKDGFKGLTRISRKGARWSFRASKARPDNGIVASIFSEVVRKYWLTTDRLTPKQIYPTFHRMCLEAGVADDHIPKERSFYRALEDVEEREAIKMRAGAKFFNSNYTIKDGTYTDAKAPLAVVMIDHTKVDVTLVDDVSGKPIGRPWLTVGIDCYSRRIWAIRVHLDGPSATENALLMINGAFKKDAVVKEYGLTGDFIYGQPSCVHADNGVDFISRAFSRGCFLNNIDLIHRPLGVPSYGGYIEAFNDTLTTYLIETLKGKTFRNVADKGDNDPEAQATLTQDQLEKLLYEFVTRFYDHHFFDELGMTPLEKWKEGLEGNETGIPVEPHEPNRRWFRQDFLPFVDGMEGTRLIEPGDGVSFRGWMYSAAELNHMEFHEGKERKRYQVRCDPNDVRYLFIYDDKIDMYYELRLASMPSKPFTLKEMEAYNRERARRKERGRVNELQALAYIYKLQEEMVIAADSDKKARRYVASRRRHQRDADSFGQPKPVVDDIGVDSLKQVRQDVKDGDIVHFESPKDGGE